MCLAVYQSTGSRMTEEEMRNAWSQNPDGGGYGFIDTDNKLKVRKFMKLADMLKMYEQDVAACGGHSPFLVHFRLATHGSKNMDNCHPFFIDEHTIMIHNGILPTINVDKSMSDSYSFATNYLAKMPTDWYDDEFLFDLVEEYCTGSKIVILTTRPSAQFSCYIVNQRSGNWSKDKSMWFSNNSHCSPRSFVFGNTGKAKQTSFTSLNASYKTSDEVNKQLESEGYTRCYFCSEYAVLEPDRICYECETCNRCNHSYLSCLCLISEEINGMTQEDYMRKYAND